VEEYKNLRIEKGWKERRDDGITKPKKLLFFRAQKLENFCVREMPQISRLFASLVI